MSYELIKVEEKFNGAVTEIILSPSPTNIISGQLMKEVEAKFEIEEKNPDKRLIIFCGEGKHFSFGASAEEHKPEDVDNMLPGFHKIIGEILNFSIPTLAKVRGLCLG